MRLLCIAVMSALVGGAPAVARDSGFDGTWTKDLKSVRGFATTPETVTFKLSGQAFRMLADNGEHYEALIGGPPVAIGGSAQPHTVAVHWAGPNTLRFDETVGGDSYACILTPRPDGKAIGARITADGGKNTSSFNWVRR